MKWLWPQRCADHVFHWTPSLSGLDQPIILYEDSLRLIEEDTVSCKTSSMILKLMVGLQATCPLPSVITTHSLLHPCLPHASQIVLGQSYLNYHATTSWIWTLQTCLGLCP